MSVINITLTTGRGRSWQIANLLQDAQARADIMVRFWALVNRHDDPTGCWPWLGDRQHGYGYFRLPGGARFRAHRFAWLMSRGEIPTGAVVCHDCDTPHCVNPAHLRLDSQAGNIHESVRKARKRAWGRQKLNAEQVLSIRARAARGERHRIIAADFGMARNSISQIVNRKVWAHLADVPASPVLSPRRLPCSGSGSASPVTAGRITSI